MNRWHYENNTLESLNTGGPGCLLIILLILLLLLAIGLATGG